MPELPEVEIVGQQLRRMMVGSHLHLYHWNPGCRVIKEATGLLQLVTDAGRIRSIERRGKYLLWRFSDPLFAGFVWHMGMTGQFRISCEPPRLDDPHLVVAFRFQPAMIRVVRFLSYRDVRKFGWVGPRWVGGETHPRLAKLGPDALTPEAVKHLGEVQSSRTVFEVLMDQRVLAGLGNIYVSETLFRAGVHPSRPWAQLAQAERQRLTYLAGDILHEAISYGGSSIRDYVHPDGETGLYQEMHKVYGRAGDFCPTCLTVIQRELLAGRAAFFCPSCQPREETHEQPRTDPVRSGKTRAE